MIFIDNMIPKVAASKRRHIGAIVMILGTKGQVWTSKSAPKLGDVPAVIYKSSSGCFKEVPGSFVKKCSWIARTSQKPNSTQARCHVALSHPPPESQPNIELYCANVFSSIPSTRSVEAKSPNPFCRS
eukprot:gnl/TRDRNA2_/TRDRNA2_119067_c0_seq1.p2 gnl/TRDRNA2_/TRDRNA2_119067_c0~~gnl/TRDRNA2_/TRDRNA2_119067_c0_seq1.p2  ORF type:complete len:128 (+),score=8.47 gnl/TRDRNA2_/TRDRNA2_119067_c0_seq1:154-537(+)